MLIDYFTDSELNELTGATRATIYRWRKNGAPVTVLNLLNTIEGNDFKHYHLEWTGWGINHKTGELYSPNNDCFKPWQIISLPYLHGALNSYKLDERERKNRDEMERQKIPDNVIYLNSN